MHIVYIRFALYVFSGGKTWGQKLRRSRQLYTHVFPDITHNCAQSAVLYTRLHYNIWWYNVAMFAYLSRAKKRDAVSRNTYIGHLQIIVSLERVSVCVWFNKYFTCAV